MRQARHVKLVALAGMRHFWHQVPIGLVGQVIADRLVRKFARHHLDLIGGRDDDFFRHVPHHFIHHEHHRHTELFRQIERLDGQVEAFLRRVRAQRDDLVVPVRAPPRLHHVGLRR